MEGERWREMQRESWGGGGRWIRMIYSFRPLPLMKRETDRQTDWGGGGEGGHDEPLDYFF